MRWRTIVYPLTLLGIGYLLGAWGAFDARSLPAQDAGAEPSDEAITKIRSAQKALKEAADALQAEGRYESLTAGVNAFLVLSGGGNARQDLESGNGVDPETFAALYAGQAIPEIQEQLGLDAENRVTYGGEVVRLYSRSRLARMFAERVKLADESP
jgi:hypothetical protein